MSGHDDLLRRFAAETEPSPDARDRVLRRMRLEQDPGAVGELLRTLPDPSPSIVARVLARVRDSIKAGDRIAMPWSPAPLVAAAVALLVLGAAALYAPRLADQPAAVMIADTLEAVDTTTNRPAPGVALSYTGWGYVSGSERQPRIHWAAGSLHVEVEPGKGLDVVVETPNGVVRVVGTVFDVDVHDLGTRVRVQRGKVEVACELGTTTLLGAGEEATCVRASAANLLTFAVEARQRESAPERVLALADQGLGLEQETSPVRDELLLVRFNSLMELGRRRDARSTADAYLENPDAPRRVDVLRTAAKLSFSDGACPVALQYLNELERSGGARADDLLPLAGCVAATEPERARSLLERAATMQPSPEVAAAIERMRSSLPEVPTR